MNQKQLIFIVGMGRSGSSAITRTVSLCGAHLPERLLGPDKGNVKGHWEPLDALELNDKILVEHGANWYDPTLRIQHEIAFSNEERERYLEEIRVFLDGCSNQPLLLIKEPRITALTEFWFEAVRRAGIDMKVIIPVRHPSEVAASLASRDSLGFELSSALWLKYNLLAERCSRMLPRVFVEFSNLLNDWRAEIARINESLSLDLRASKTAEIEEFLSEDLYHERDCDIPMDVFGQTWMPSVYATLSAAARGNAVNTQLMDDVFVAFSSCEKAFRVAMDQFRGWLPPPAAPADAQIAQLGNDLLLANKKADELATHVWQHEEALARKSAQIAQAENFIAYISERYTAISRDKDKVGSLNFRFFNRTRKLPDGVSQAALDAIRNSAFFDAAFYLNANLDVKADGMDPALHYLHHGGFEGRDPGPFFSTKEYLARNPDVAKANSNALVHYEVYGRSEGRKLSWISGIVPSPSNATS
jgi:hypothetical protein